MLMAGIESVYNEVEIIFDNITYYWNLVQVPCLLDWNINKKSGYFYLKKN